MRTASILTALAFVAGCTPIFDADFEGDANFQPPNLNPPGPPVGDTITLQSGAGSEIIVVPDLVGDHALRIEAGSNGIARAILNAVEPTDLDRPIIVGMTQRVTPGSRAEINVSTGGPLFAVQITLEDGTITINGQDNGSYVEGGVHQFVLTMFPNTDTFTLAFSGQVLFGDAFVGDLNGPADFPSNDISVVVEADAGGSVIIIDEARISSRNF